MNTTKETQQPPVLIAKTPQHGETKPVLVPASRSSAAASAATLTATREYRAARNRHTRYIVLACVGLLGTVTLVALSLTHVAKPPEYIPSPPPVLQPGVLHEIGTIEALSEQMVLSKFSGDILWKIDEGTLVEPGEPVVIFEDRKEREDLDSREKDLFDKQEAVRRAKADLATAIEKYKCQIRQAEIALDEAEIDRKHTYDAPLPDDKMDAELTLKSADLELKQMQEQVDAQEDLHKLRYISDVAFKKAMLDLVTKKVNFSKAKLLFDLTLQGATVDAKRVADLAVADAKKTLQIAKFNRDADVSVDQAALEMAQIDLNNFQRDLKRKQDAVANATVRAPVRGRVSFLEVWKGSSKSKSPIQVGENRGLGQDLCAVCDTSSLRVKVQVNENDIRKAAVKQKARVTLPALPGRTFEAEVSEIGIAAQDKNQALSSLAMHRSGEAFVNVIQVKLVFVGLTEQDKRDVRIGFSADVYIETGSP